jgi:hypothetical protein
MTKEVQLDVVDIAEFHVVLALCCHLLQPKQHCIGLLSKSHGIEPHHLQSPFCM